jgi:polar amino acid transport system permease protein
MMEFIIEYIPLVIKGFIVTAQVTFFGIAFGLILGTLLAIGDMYGGKVISTIIRFYVEFFRGSSLVIQLFIFYFAIPNMLNTVIDSFIVGLIVFGLNSAAYQKGYIKGAMESVYEDQMTAAQSIGLSRGKAIMYVILPQAARIMIPSWSNEFCSLAKATSSLLVIGERELTYVGKTIAADTYRILETYAFIALIYLVWITAIVKLFDIINNKVKIPGIEATV